MSLVPEENGAGQEVAVVQEASQPEVAAGTEVAQPDAVPRMALEHEGRRQGARVRAQISTLAANAIRN